VLGWRYRRGRPVCGSGVASLSPAVEGLREKWSGESYLIFNQNRGAAKKGMREIRATALTEMGEVW